MSTRTPRILVAATLCLLCSCATPGPIPDLPVVAHLDLVRYAGTWYEIASYPNRFQKDCVATRATYTLRDDGKVGVLNQCRRGSLQAPWDAAEGTAKVPDPATNAKLKVTFFWPFYGDYWVLDLDPEYRWALVGSPSREYLWVLSRSPTMAEAVLRRLEEKARSLGFPPDRLVKTPQEPDPSSGQPVGDRSGQ